MEKYSNNKNKTNRTNKTNINTDKTSADTVDILEENPKDKISKLAEILFNTDINGEKNYDSALYTIIKIDNKNTLVKVGEGDFDLEDFNQENINKINKYSKNKTEEKDYKSLKGFSRTPMPLFVVDKINSSLASTDQLEEMKNHPKKYLNQYADIVVTKRKQAYINNSNNINFNDINILYSETLLAPIKNEIIEIYIPQYIENNSLNKKEKIQKAYTEITTLKKKNIDALYSYLYTNSGINNPINKLLEIIAIGKKAAKERKDEEKKEEKNKQKIIKLQKAAIPKIYNLIQSFNTNKNQFE